MKKTVKISIITSLLAIMTLLTSCAISNEPCEYCNDTPTRGYKTTDGEKFYVCSECSSECMFCGDKARKHYTNMLGMVMFACNDCYESIVE